VLLWSSLAFSAAPLTKMKDCAACPEVIVLPPGQFTMGDLAPPQQVEEWKGERPYDRGWELPAHAVAISKPIAMGRFEVTKAEYAAFVSATHRAQEPGCWTRQKGEWALRPEKSWHDPDFAQGDRDPVVCVNRADVDDYLAWLSQTTGARYRLPTEAEWEYAARAGTTTDYAWGNELGQGRANCRNCGSPWDGKGTAPVGSFAPNAWGLHDMNGNVWEPLQDCFHIGYGGAPSDGSSWNDAACAVRVLRGSSWYDLGAGMRSAFRGRGNPLNRICDLGFRVVREVD
jgi:formylglycine-generating enzyme required for sulfatase activity